MNKTVPASEMERAQRIMRKAMRRIAEFPKINADPFVFVAVVNVSVSAIYTELLSSAVALTPESVEKHASVAANLFRQVLTQDLTARMAAENNETRQ